MVVDGVIPVIGGSHPLDPFGSLYLCLVLTCSGIVKLGEEESFGERMVGCPGVLSGRGRKGSRVQESVTCRSQQVTAESEEIVERHVEGKKPLGLTSRFESAHQPFPLAGRLIRGLSAVRSS